MLMTYSEKPLTKRSRRFYEWSESTIEKIAVKQVFSNFRWNLKTPLTQEELQDLVYHRIVLLNLIGLEQCGYVQRVEKCKWKRIDEEPAVGV